MKDFDWRVRYAPHGYAYVKHRIGFDTLHFARLPSVVIRHAMEDTQLKLAKDCPYFYDGRLAQTRVSVFPKEVGESLNHLDPLKPRFGIEIEIRQPMPENVRR